MKTILLAVLLLAAPAFARHDRDDDDDDYEHEEQQQYAPQYGQQQYAPPDQGPTYDDFRNDSELSWNGEWIDTPEYGTVWRPTRVSDSWQPYSYGRWAWTNAGWAWVSEEPFGWAVYHYGRWAYSPAGWLWIPGRIWAPAWVSWRWGDGYAGWCPLGPRRYVYEQPAQWVFVRKQHFLEPVRSNIAPRAFGQSMPTPGGRGPFAGPPIHAVEQATGRTVHPLAVTDAPAPHAAQATSGSVGFYRPRTAPVAIPAPQGQGQPQRFGGQPRAQQSEPRGQQNEPRGQQAGPHAQQAEPHAQPQEQGGRPTHPFYFGGVPAPRQGAQQRPAPAPRAGAAPHAAPSTSGQAEPHAKER